MFSAIGAPKEDEQEDIDWISDLKFFIDNDDKMLTNYLFPAVKRHEQNLGNPQVFKVYLKPINSCLNQYCEQFDIEDRDEKFPKEKLIELAKKVAEEQEKFIKNGDYASS